MFIVRKIIKYGLILITIFAIAVLLPMVRFFKQDHQEPLPNCFKKGVYHLHSIHSDGGGITDEICAAGNKRGLDFVILTDHGNPNLLSSSATAWKENLLLIGGTEISLHCGHLSALGYKLPSHKFPPEGQEAINDVTELNGFSIISHPFDDKIAWTNWQVKGFAGIEILNTYTQARKLNIFKIIVLPWQYLIHPQYTLLSANRFPEKNMAKWQEIMKYQPCFGIYALDAHQKLKISENFFLKIPSYYQMFGLYTIYVKIKSPLTDNAQDSASIVLDSIKAGRFFNTMEALSSANGFDCNFVDQQNITFPMGSSSSASQGTMNIDLPFQFSTQITIFKDNHILKQIYCQTQRKLKIPIKDPGNYVIMVKLDQGPFKHLPWILSNPFYIGTQFSQEKEVLINSSIKKPVSLPISDFQVEKNVNSEYLLKSKIYESAETIIELKYRLKADPNQKEFWVALALRNKIDLSGFMGIYFEAKCGKSARFWLELRNQSPDGESNFTHSFLVRNEWQPYYLPLTSLNHIYGPNTSLNPAAVSALFFSINQDIAYLNSNDSLEIKNVMVY
jgi:hypothetical protein